MEEKKVENVQKDKGVPIEYALLVALIASIALAAVCYLGNNAPTPEPCISPFRGHLEPCYPGRSNSAAHLYESSHRTITDLAQTVLSQESPTVTPSWGLGIAATPCPFNESRNRRECFRNFVGKPPRSFLYICWVLPKGCENPRPGT